MNQELPKLPDIVRRKRFGESDIIGLFEALATQIKNCHSRNVPHGPLGPETVVLTSEGFQFATIEGASTSSNDASNALISNFTRAGSYDNEKIKADFHALVDVIDFAIHSRNSANRAELPAWFQQILQELKPDQESLHEQIYNLGPALAAVRKHFHKAEGIFDGHRQQAGLQPAHQTKPRGPVLTATCIINLALVMLTTLALVALRSRILPTAFPVEGIRITNINSDVESYWLTFFVYYGVLAALPVVILTALTRGLLHVLLAWVFCSCALIGSSYAMYYGSANILMSRRFPSTDPYITTTCARIALEQITLIGLLAPAGNNYSFELRKGAWEVFQGGPVSLYTLWYYIFYFPYFLVSTLFIWGEVKGLKKVLLHGLGLSIMAIIIASILRFSMARSFGTAQIADQIFLLSFDYFSITLGLVLIVFLIMYSLFQRD
jgi:hypothetical protein